MERRDFLVKSLAAGLFTGVASQPVLAQFWGKRTKALPDGQSFHQLRGEVMVNGNMATAATPVKPGDKVTTGNDGKAVFVVGKDAFSIGENSELVLDGEIIEDRSAIIRAFSLLSGKLLTVFGSTGHKVQTPHSTIGIRGTGVYLEAEADRTYLCVCYGTVDIQSKIDPSAKMTTVSEYHDKPVYLNSANADSKAIADAPMKNHDDMELIMLEALVGREVPFPLGGAYYGAPKRSDY